MQNFSRIVITGVGLTSPNANNISELYSSMMTGKSGIREMDVRYMGKYPAGLASFDEYKYHSKKARRRGTRAGSIAIYCAHEALNDAGIMMKDYEDPSRVGVFLGITEHGNVETEEEIYQLHQNHLDVNLWSHHHNPRTVSNSPAGEVTLSLGITGPHYTLGAACAAGNLGPIEGANQLRLGLVDVALCGGISESPQTFGIFAAFKAQGALSECMPGSDVAWSCRPLDKERNGIVIAEGGAVFVLERLEDALKRGAKIYGEIAGHHLNSDASDFVLPNAKRQVQCMEKALQMAQMTASNIDIVNLHATGTEMGDIVECDAVRELFDHSDNTFINASKALIGHAMGAAGILELAGNLLSFKENWIHPAHNIQELDPRCALKNLLVNQPREKREVKAILNNSFGMLGINSVLIVKKF